MLSLKMANLNGVVREVSLRKYFTRHLTEVKDQAVCLSGERAFYVQEHQVQRSLGIFTYTFCTLNSSQLLTHDEFTSNVEAKLTVFYNLESNLHSINDTMIIKLSS